MLVDNILRYTIWKSRGQDVSKLWNSMEGNERIKSHEGGITKTYLEFQGVKNIEITGVSHQK